jgi:hypothetical protein
MSPPSPNGRSARGRFASGNPGGPRNPYAKRVAALRAALLESVTEADIRAVARALVTRAKAGEVPTIRELLDRLAGKHEDAIPEMAGPPIIKVVVGLPDYEPVELTAVEAYRVGIIRVNTGVPRGPRDWGWAPKQ